MAYITVKIITVLVPIQWCRKQIERKRGGEGARLIKNIDKQKKKRSLVMAMFNFAKKIAEPLKKSKKSKIFYQ